MHKTIILLFILISLICFNGNSANRYWVGGSGTWDNTSTSNWSNSSGGAPGSSVPISSDAVIFDANSFSTVSQTVTLGSTVSFASITFTGVTNSPTLNGGFYDMNCYGNATFTSSMFLSTTWTAFIFKSSGTLNSGGLNLNFYYIQASTGATLSLGSNLNSTSGYLYISSATGVISLSSYTVNVPYISMTNGTLNLNTSVLTTTSASTISGGTLNQNTSTPNFAGITVSGGTLTFGTTAFTTNYLNATSGTLTFSSGGISITGSTSNELAISSIVNVTTGTPTITFTGTYNSGNRPIELYLGTKTLYNLSFSLGNYSISFYDGGTVNSVTFAASSWAIFESSKTFTFSSSFNTTTSCTSYSLISSSTPGSAATIAFPATALSYIQMKDITHLGVTKTCSSCVNAGTNTNFTFSSAYVARTLYWMGTGSGDGNWSTGSNWTTNSGGASSGNTCVPTIVDAVIFDGNSFDAVSKTVAIDQRVTAASINFTGTINSPAITNTSSQDIIVTGNLTLISGIGTITNSGAVYFIGSSAQQITCGNKKLSSGTTYFNNPSTIYSQDDGYYGTIYIKSGTFEARNSGLASTFNTYFSGDWYLTGTFNPGSNSSKYVIFNGTATDQYIYSATTFYNLKLDCTGFNTLNTSADVTITNELLIAGGMYENTSNKTTNVSGSVNLTSATSSSCYLYINSGTFSYLNDSQTNFNVANGDIWAWGGTLNVGVVGTQTTTVLNIGDGTLTTGQSNLYISGGTVNIVDRLIIDYDGIIEMASGTLNIKTNTTNGGTAATSKFQVKTSGQFKQSGGTINILGAADANTTPAISFNSGSTFNPTFITGGTIVLKSTTSSYDYPVDFGGQTIYNLTVNQASRTFYQKTNDVTLKGSLTITSGAYTYNTSGITTYIAGNFANSGTYTHNNCTVVFNGGSAQNISGLGTTFYKTTINNTLGGVTLGVATTITNTLTLTSGKFYTAGNILTLGTASANATISGGGISSYVVAYDNSGTIGYLKHFINSNTSYTYPIGDATYYTPLTFTLTSNSGLSNAYYIVYTKPIKIPGLSSTFTSYLTRFWEGTSSGITTPVYSLTYTYNNLDIVGEEANLLPVKKSGSTWYKPTGSTFTTGIAQGTGSVNTGTNTLTWTGLSTFSYIGGAGTQVTGLPIELVTFNGQKENRSNLLKWTTNSESNNDYFTIEKTNDGSIFETIGLLKGAGKSVFKNEYELNDFNFQKTINYYRLKQTDFDGNSTLSEIISIDNRENESNSKTILSITNILGQQVTDSFKGLIIISYSDGSSLKSIR